MSLTRNAGPEGAALAVEIKHANAATAAATKVPLPCMAFPPTTPPGVPRRSVREKESKPRAPCARQARVEHRRARTRFDAGKPTTVLRGCAGVRATTPIRTPPYPELFQRRDAETRRCAADENPLCVSASLR